MSFSLSYVTDQIFSSEYLLSETRPRSRSTTSNLSTHDTQRQDEVIAYEDTVEDNNDELDGVSTLRTVSGIQGSRVVSTISKRSYDEHESDQLENVDAQDVSSASIRCFYVCSDLVLTYHRFNKTFEGRLKSCQWHPFIVFMA